MEMRDNGFYKYLAGFQRIGHKMITCGSPWTLWPTHNPSHLTCTQLHSNATPHVYKPTQWTREPTLSSLALVLSLCFFFKSVTYSVKSVSLSFIFSMILKWSFLPCFMANSLNVVLGDTGTWGLETCKNFQGWKLCWYMYNTCSSLL